MRCGLDGGAAPAPAAAVGDLAPGGLRRLVRSSASPLLCLMLAWSGLSFGYYGLSTWVTVLLAQSGVPDANAVSVVYAAANLPGNLASVALIDRLGRKRLLVGAMALSAACTMARNCSQCISRPPRMARHRL